MTHTHGTTNEDVRRDEENDERNYRRAKGTAGEAGCCLLQAVTVLFFGVAGLIPLLMR